MEVPMGEMCELNLAQYITSAGLSYAAAEGIPQALLELASQARCKTRMCKYFMCMCCLGEA